MYVYVCVCVKEKLNYSMKKLFQCLSAYGNCHIDRIAFDRILTSAVEN